MPTRKSYLAFLPFLLTACSATVDTPVDPALVDSLEGAESYPQGVVQGVTLNPKDLLPAPTVTLPKDVRLPPIIRYFGADPTGIDAALPPQPTCLHGRGETEGEGGASINWDVWANSSLASIEIFRNGVNILTLPSPTVAQQQGTLAIPRERFLWSAPDAAITYGIRVTDVGGRVNTKDVTYHVAPTPSVNVSAPIVTGPHSGAGRRVLRFHWSGYNIGRLHLKVTVSGNTLAQDVPTGLSSPWGPVAGDAEVSLDFSAAEWANWRLRQGRFSVDAFATTASGCSNVWHVSVPYATLPAVPPTPASPPTTSPPTAWQPTNCVAACNWADYPGWVVKTYAETLECGATPDLRRVKYLMCSLAGAPSSAEVAVCATQEVPSGWTNVRTETRWDMCVPLLGSPANNVRVIRKL